VLISRRSSILTQAILRIVAIAIAIVIGHTAPALETRQAAGPVVCSTEGPTKADALRAGERAEPRVAPAPPLDHVARLPVYEPAGRCPAFHLEARALALLPASQARDQRLIVLQNIPRLESGDPPRS
jgi:hypothetical protein